MSNRCVNVMPLPKPLETSKANWFYWNNLILRPAFRFLSRVEGMTHHGALTFQNTARHRLRLQVHLVLLVHLTTSVDASEKFNWFEFCHEKIGADLNDFNRDVSVLPVLPVLPVSPSLISMRGHVLRMPIAA